MVRYGALTYPGLYINQEAVPAIKEFMKKGVGEKINRSVINVMMEEACRKGH